MYVASVARAEPAGSTEIIAVNIGEEFMEVLTSSITVKKIVNTTHRVTEETDTKLETLEIKLDKLFRGVIDSKSAPLDDVAALAQSYLNMSSVYIRGDQKMVYIGIDYLTRCLELLKGNELDRKVILIVMKAAYELSCVWFILEKAEESKLFIDKVLQLCLTYVKNEVDDLTPINITTVLGLETEENSITLQGELCTHILDSFIVTFGKMMLDSFYHLTRIYIVIRIQSRCIERFPPDYYIGWIKNLTALSFWFTSNGRFTEARHYLAVASYETQKFYTERYMKLDQQEFPNKKAFLHDLYKETSATVDKYWAKYGIALLRFSRERLLQNKMSEKLCETSNQESQTGPEERSTKLLLFEIEEHLDEYNSLITDKDLLDYDSAKTVSTIVLKWLNKIKEYFTPEKVMLDYVDVIRDISKTYKYLACYKENLDDRVKIHELRIEALENVVKILSSKIYTNICQHIWIELAVIYAILADIKMEQISIMPKMDKEIIEQANNFMRSAQYNFQLYFGSFETSSLTNE